jgi:hypothetical protein
MKDVFSVLELLGGAESQLLQEVRHSTRISNFESEK